MISVILLVVEDHNINISSFGWSKRIWNSEKNETEFSTKTASWLSDSWLGTSRPTHGRNTSFMSSLLDKAPSKHFFARIENRVSTSRFSKLDPVSTRFVLGPNEKNGNSRIEFSVSSSHQTTSRYDEGNDRLHHGDHQPTKAFKTTMKCLGFPSLLFLLALCIFCLSAKATINFGDDENEEEDDLLFVLCFRGCPESCPFQGKMTKAIEPLSILWFSIVAVVVNVVWSLLLLTLISFLM